ncbi:hypothetical protein SASPL_149501 [Salvia splendens]|uniref:Uncharacterized protein n=1 Tax=Salvia splendens TaxID=180675 RepID=A0A8X8YW73_SALSN|nr:hypothetical protein SASPL_156990 [Salvia splendens]KAG6391742.1 hypothetical protein SASPL_149501 [Salvia splendens]
MKWCSCIAVRLEETEPRPTSDYSLWPSSAQLKKKLGLDRRFYPNASSGNSSVTESQGQSVKSDINHDLGDKSDQDDLGDKSDQDTVIGADYEHNSADSSDHGSSSGPQPEYPPPSVGNQGGDLKWCSCIAVRLEETEPRPTSDYSLWPSSAQLKKKLGLDRRFYPNASSGNCVYMLYNRKRERARDTHNTHNT